MPCSSPRRKAGTRRRRSNEARETGMTKCWAEGDRKERKKGAPPRVEEMRGIQKQKTGKKGTKMYTAAGDRYGTMCYNRCGQSGLMLPAVSLGFWHNFGDTATMET